MVGRAFNGTSDSITLAGTALPTTTGVSIVAVARFTALSGTSQMLYRAANTIGNTVFRISATSSNITATLNTSGASPTPGTPIVPATGEWVLIAVTHHASAAPRFHYYRYSTDTWVRSDSGTTVGSHTAATAGASYLGAFTATSNYLSGSLAAVGLFAAALTDDQMDALPHSLTVWRSSSPWSMWLLDQSDVSQAVPDLGGHGADQSAISGTAVSSLSAPLGYGHPVLIPSRTVGGGAEPGSGTVAATLPAVTASAAGEAAVTATAAATLPTVTAALSGASGEPVDAALSATLPAAQAGASGTVAVSGALDSPVPAAAASVAGAVTAASEFAVALPAASSLAAATTTVAGATAAQLPTAAAAAAGAAAVTGELVPTLPAVVAALHQDAPTPTGDLTATVPPAVASAAGTLTVTGTTTATLPPVTAAATATLAVEAATAAVLPAATAALTVAAPADVVLAATLPAVTAALSGQPRRRPGTLTAGGIRPRHTAEATRARLTTTTGRG